MPRRFQFSLRALLVVVVFAAALSAGVQYRNRLQIAEASAEFYRLKHLLDLHREKAWNDEICDDDVEEVEGRISRLEGRLKSLKGY